MCLRMHWCDPLAKAGRLLPQQVLQTERFKHHFSLRLLHGSALIRAMQAMAH